MCGLLRGGISWWRACRGSTQGFAATDALVALMILSTVVVFSLSAAATARRAAINALEMRRADQMMQGLLQTGGAVIGETDGRVGNLQWRIITEPEPSEVQRPGVQLCRRSAMVRAVASGRRYHLSATQICPAPRT